MTETPVAVRPLRSEPAARRLARGARRRYWRTRYARWGAVPAPSVPGYALLVPVPGDLPFFVDIALAVCRTQTAAARVETLVVPDRWTPGFAASLERASAGWPGELRALRLALPERAVLPRLADPGRNHGAQIIAALRRVRASHIVLHDADLFALDPALHDAQHARTVADDLDALGVDPAWDPWFAARGRRLAATWEMSARTAWLRSFPPHRLMSHDAVVDGERHTFDTSFWPQLMTDPARIAVADVSGSLVHFNHLISTYRYYQDHRGSFHDGGFRLLVLRVLVDAFAGPGEDHGVPSADQLVAGLAGGPGRVRYEPGDAAAYRTTRADLETALEGPWSSPERRGRTAELLRAFDQRFGAS